MKLSNKILLAFFGIIFLYINAAFIELRMTGTLSIVNDKNSIAEKIDFTGINYLVLENSQHTINVIADDNTRLEVRSFTGEVLKQLKYEVKGDTLKVSGLPEETKKVKITVFIAQADLKGITINNTHVTIHQLRQDSLVISESEGRVWMSNCKVGKIQMTGSKRSSLDFNSSNVDTLSLKLHSSQVMLYASLELLEGSMEHDSFVTARDVKEIRFKKDDSSRMNLYE